ncbi:MAG: DUF2088 domain-containing protein [Syntrophobacterales bacterium]|nr:MAG: DUF2088 domain-containing protein [Syntrophobacterales bacterium]
MKLDHIDVEIVDGYDIPLPKMVKVKQHFKRERLENPANTIISEMNNTLVPSDFKGKRIAITIGSRGIAQLASIIQTIINQLKKWGAQPFIIPAMGSHGGAKAKGQEDIVAGYGITEEKMGVPVLSSLEVVQVATLSNGMPVYCDRIAHESDGIVVVNRVKPHTDFKGDYESGLLKMIGIGLGDHKGATILHSYGFDQMSTLLPQLGEAFIRNAPVAFGVAILENAFDELMKVEILRPEQFLPREKELLVLAKENIAKLPVSSIDVLIIEEIGKDISGSGMDPNVTGIPGSGLTEGFIAPPIQKIVVLRLTQNAHGNGTGIGLADVSTIRCINQIDWGITYTNCITAAVTEPAKMPIVMNTDREALVVALKTCARVSSENAKIVRIKNTLELSEIDVSVSCLPELQGREDISILSDPQPLQFTGDGWLI